MKRKSSSGGWSGSNRATGVQSIVKPAVPQPNKYLGLGMHCFKCGMLDNHPVECSKVDLPGKMLFLEIEDSMKD